jgi:hypothetical protein
MPALQVQTPVPLEKGGEWKKDHVRKNLGLIVTRSKKYIYNK